VKTQDVRQIDGELVKLMEFNLRALLQYAVGLFCNESTADTCTRESNTSIDLPEC